MSVLETLIGAEYDSLMGGASIDTRVRNVKISSDTTIVRGQLLAGAYDGSDVTVHIATAADATNGNELFIAATDDEEVTVTTAYSSGEFNRSAILTDEDINEFEGELRRQGIMLTEVM